MIITDEISIDEFKPWSGGVYTYNELEKLDALRDFEALIKELYPEGCSSTKVNDILWHDSEWVFETLGYAYCDCCDSWVEEDELTTVYIDDAGNTEDMCDCCIEDSTSIFKCECCDEYFNLDCTHIVHEGKYYCKECAEYLEDEWNEEQEDNEDE